MSMAWRQNKTASSAKTSVKIFVGLPRQRGLSDDEGFPALAVFSPTENYDFGRTSPFWGRCRALWPHRGRLVAGDPILTIT